MNFFLHQGGLGDWVLTFPILRALTGPTVVAAPWSKAVLAADLFENVKPLNIELREFSRLHAPGGPAAMAPAIQELVDQANLIISFLSDGSDDWARNIRRVAPGAKHVFLQPRPPDSWRRHLCDWHDQQLREQDVDLPEVQIPRCEQGDGRVLIHPGSGGQDKCWPVEHFERLIQTLRASGRTIGAVLGEVERETWSAAVLDRWRERYGAEMITSLQVLRDRLAATEHYVGNDSGPTHLAAQMGLSTVALFGPTCPTRWGPRGPDVTILAPPQPSPMTWLPVELVAKVCGVEA